MKKRLLVSLVFTLFLLPFLYSQKSNNSIFEGILRYKIHYHPNARHVKSSDLEHQLGNLEIVSIKGGQYKSEHYYNDKLLRTIIYDNTKQINYVLSKDAPYWIKNQVNSDVSKRILPVDTTVLFDKTPCDVFRFVKTSQKTTYYIVRGKQYESNHKICWFSCPNPFDGPVWKIEMETQDYTLTQDLISMKDATLDAQIFEPKGFPVAVSPEMISNQVVKAEDRREIQRCLYQSIGYPGFLNLQHLEGKIFIELYIDSSGSVKNTGIKTEFYKKEVESIRIYNYKKINRIEQHIQKKILPSVQSCLAKRTFEAPICNQIHVSTLLCFPILFNRFVEDEEENMESDDTPEDDFYYDDYEIFY